MDLPSTGSSDLHLTNRIICQGRALVRAIESLTTIDLSGLFERMIAGLLVAGYKRRLQAVLRTVRDHTEGILSTSEHSRTLWQAMPRSSRCPARCELTYADCFLIKSASQAERLGT